MTTVFSGDVLIVEDNVIIAMDIEELVTELGASNTHIATTAHEALAVLKTQLVQAAILDFDLEGETSAPVAEALAQSKIPFVFATGHGDPSVLPDAYRDQPILKKPYSMEDIRGVFAQS